jgi:hypothetical protein
MLEPLKRREEEKGNTDLKKSKIHGIFWKFIPK